MKFLLAAVNAKYIHSNLGIYSLKAYAKSRVEGCEIELGEYTINHQADDVLRDIYLRKPDVLGFSCYIWNIEFIKSLLRDLPKLLPQTEIWLGGPEVSYDSVQMLQSEPDVRGIMMGEGEAVFTELVRSYLSSLYMEGKGSALWADIPGLAYRGEGEESICINPLPEERLDLNTIPFPYGGMSGFEHRIVYYESSRGCPFSCSYCLSSIEKSVRFRDTSLVKQELEFFLKKKVPQVKFVDRTFNASRKHAMEIWQYILEQDTGKTNFHFEISADLLGEEELELLQQMRPGLVQLEIGVQSTNPETIREIRRSMNLSALTKTVEQINEFHNIHQHLDLIAGLPYEDMQRFSISFDQVYAMKPEQLQLGFLKVLKGSYMGEQRQAYGLQCKSNPPYEVLSTNWLSYGDVLKLKAVEEMVEVHYNSGQFHHTMNALAADFDSAFAMYQMLADYYDAHQLSGIKHSRLARYEVLYQWIQEVVPDRLEAFRDHLIHDLYLREYAKSRPSFARDQTPYKADIRDFFIEEQKKRRYLIGYEGYDSRQMSNMAHIEVMGDGRMVLYDYRNRDPLNHNASVWVVNGSDVRNVHG